MRHLIAAAVLGASLSAVSGHGVVEASTCGFPIREPVTVERGVRIMFVNECGQWYQVGYRLEGTTLHFPTGGTHTVEASEPAEAERVLRDAYGLIGEREALIRTKW